MVKNESGKVLARHNLNLVGRDLDKTQENFRVVKSAIDVSIKSKVPSGATARQDYTTADYDYLIAELPQIVQHVEKELCHG